MNAAYLAAEAGIAVESPVSEQPSDPEPVTGCGCGSSGQGTAHSPDEMAAINQLAVHYQALFAQYARLHSDGRLTQYDFAHWQQTRAAYDAAMAAAGRKPAPGQ
jgi:hypothetical protein